MPHSFCLRPAVPRWLAVALALSGSLGQGCAHAQVPEDADMPGSKRPTTQGRARARDQRDPQAFRHHVPDPGAIARLQAPVPHVTKLANGLAVWVVPKRDLPLISAALIVRAGAAQDPRGGEGTASLLVDAMKLGTTTRSAATIADEIESLGSSLDAGVGEDATTFEVQALTGNLAPVLSVMADVVQRPKLDEHDVRRAKDAQLAELVQVAGEPRASVRQVFRRVAFGEQHPYGHASRGLTSSVRGLQKAWLQAFHAAHFRPGNAALVIVGDIDEAGAQQLAERAFGAWQGSEAGDPPPPAATARSPEVTLVSRPGAPQSQLMVGGLGVARSSEDYYALTLCNAVLGGMFNSRINMNLREEKGWTYGARSSFTFLRSRGSFSVDAGVRTDVTAPAVHEIFAEIERMRTEPIHEDELRAAKNRYVLSLPGSLQTMEAIGNMVAALVMHDLPPTYLRELADHLEAVSVADVQRVAQTYLNPREMHVVVVGDRSKVAEGLLGLRRGPVQMRDSEGLPLGHRAGNPAP